MPATWYCCRQRAGPLVKECRALRPRFDRDDTAQDHREKAEVKKYERGAVTRKQTDRLELMLALIGWRATHYTLTFDSDSLPKNFKGVRERSAAFRKRLRRFLPDEIPLDYVYCIEGLHGDHRYHIHFVADGNWIPPLLVQTLWRYGQVEDEPVIHLRSYYDEANDRAVDVCDDGFRRLAEYLTKERTDGVVIPIGRHPWSASRSLRARLPDLEKWTASDGVTSVPEDAVWVRRSGIANDFGAYYYTSYIAPDESQDYKRMRACARARAIQYLKSSGKSGTNKEKAVERLANDDDA